MIKAKHKNELINRIRSIKNKDVLDEVHRLLDIDIEDDTVYQVSEEQKKEITMAQDQIRQGKGIRSNQADREIDKWLDK
ncbi:MAG: hypothetical protein RLO81_06905 [Fulvivirga sp.]|uniref:hypothetical protein n=1 Tax=Fulvivirga sp. TaxID=1931237 RepID=UPI0032ECFA3C